MTTLELQFAAGLRFVEAVGQRIWVQDIRVKAPIETYIERCGRAAEKFGLPCIITPQDLELDPRLR